MANARIADLESGQGISDARARIDELEIHGCTDPEAANFACTVNVDDGSCEYPGCTDPEAGNFDPGANVDDGSCYFPSDIPGFTFVEINARGYPEYTHDLSGIRFVRLPGGSFEMGSPAGEPGRRTDEGPVHTVTLSPFLITKYEVTQEVWAAVMARHPTVSANPSRYTGDDQRPVDQVSWDDIQEFEALTGLQLPSEAQREYAARGGTHTAFSFGDECNLDACNINSYACEPADDFMWWCDNAGGTTHPVGEKMPNLLAFTTCTGTSWSGARTGIKPTSTRSSSTSASR